MADADPSLADVLFVEYVIHNRSSQAIPNLYAALFFDWDFPWDSGSSDVGGYDAGAGVGWMNVSGGSRYRGLTVLTPQGVAAYRYFRNDPVIYDGFGDAEKWAAMAGGFGQVSSESPSDGSHLISTGPYIVGPNDSVLAAFAIIGATNLLDLFASAENAKALYSGLCSCPAQGDHDGDGPIDGLGLAIQIDIVFFGQTDSQSSFCPSTRGDYDGNGRVNAVDLARMIGHVYFGGDGPSDPCPE